MVKKLHANFSRTYCTAENFNISPMPRIDSYTLISAGFVKSSAAGQGLSPSLIAATICSLQTRSG